MEKKTAYRGDVLKLYGDNNLNIVIRNAIRCPRLTKARAGRACSNCDEHCLRNLQVAIIDYIKDQLFAPEFEETELEEYYKTGDIKIPQKRREEK